MDGESPNLLTLALAQFKPAWHIGETVWIWKRKVYLSNDDCFIRMHIVGYEIPLTVFYLDLAAGEWKVSVNTLKYQDWVGEYQATQKG